MNSAKEKFNIGQAVKRLNLANDELSADELQRIKGKVLTAIALAPSGAANAAGFGRARWHYALRYAISLIAGLCLLSGTAYAANFSKPGDVLYPVKRATEQVRLTLAVNQQSKAQLKAEFAQERLKELKQLTEQDEAETANNNVNATGTFPALSLHIFSTTTTSTLPNIHRQNEKLIQDAENEAQAEVNDAIDALNKVQSQLQASGNAAAASVVQQNIDNLKNNAKQRHVLKKEMEDGFATSTNFTFPPMPDKVFESQGNGSVNIDVNNNASSTVRTHIERHGNSSSINVDTNSTGGSASSVVNQVINSNSSDNFSTSTNHTEVKVNGQTIYQNDSAGDQNFDWSN